MKDSKLSVFELLTLPSTSKVLVAVTLVFMLSVSLVTTYAWGEEADVQQELVGPVLICDEGNEDQSEADAVPVALTEGWQQAGTCEWRINEERCLVIRPIDKATNQGRLPSISDGRSAPWGDSRQSIFSVRIEGDIEASEEMVLFGGCENLTTIEGLSNVDTSMVRCFGSSSGWLENDASQNLGGLFSGCASLREIDLSGFDTSNATDMTSMFSGCASLESLDLSSFNTTNVASMRLMFYGCASLEELDLSGFDTSSVTDMALMFYQGYPNSATGKDPDSKLRSINVSTFNTANVTDMHGMFAYCTQLESIDLSSFNTSKVKKFSEDAMEDHGTGMFAGCRKLTTLDVSGFDTSNAIYFGTEGRFDHGMFYGCESLTELDVSSFDTSKSEAFANMFAGCRSIKKLDLSSFNTWNAKDLRSMFYGCSSLEEVDVRSFDTSIVTNMSGMFENCSALKDVDLSSFDTAKVEYIGDMFLGCASLSKLDVSNFDTSRVKQNSNGRTPVFDQAIKEIKVGEKYTLQNSFPEGKWYNSKGAAFKIPADIPLGVADTYTAAVMITNITIKQPSTTLLDTGGSVQLEAAVEPADTTEKVYWFSTDGETLSVDQNGYVIGLKDGIATVRATAAESADDYYSYPTDSIDFRVGKRVEEIALSEYAKVVKVDDGPFTLTATVTPVDALNGAIGWSSSDTSVATVNSSGVVTPVAPGSAVITASAGTLSAQCALTVLDADGEIKPVESVTLDKISATLTGKETVQLSATIAPADATYNGVRWTSANEGIATVSQLGVVTSQGKGTTTITATSLDGAASATCTVKVLNPPTLLSFDAAPAQVKIGQTEKLSVRTTGDLPGSTEEVGQIDWTVSDSLVASLASSGTSANITGRSIGGVAVQASASYGGVPLQAETSLRVVWADAESVTLDTTSCQAVVGADGITLAASIAPESASGAAIAWSSSDPEVATVDQAGNILFHKAGVAKIYARSGAAYAECLVEVDPRSIPVAEGSDLDGYLLVEDSEVSRSLDGLRLIVNNDERKTAPDMNGAATESLEGSVSLADLYDVYLVDESGAYRPWASPSADSVTVCVALSDSLESLVDTHDLFVRYISDDLASKEMMESWVEGKSLKFNTTHFSTYAVLAQARDAGASDGESVRNETSVGGSLAQTGDTVDLTGLWALLVLACAATVTCRVYGVRKESR